VDTFVGIGDFSKMTYLSIKALRHYHDVGLLEPASIDPLTGYRRYATSQVPIAHAIRRFRELEMPIEEIRLVLDTRDVAARNRAILGHLERMQRQLEQTQSTVASLQEVLSSELHAEGRVAIRSLPAVSVLSEVSTVEFDDCAVWLEPTLAVLHDRVEAAGLVISGADGALYSDEFFEAGEGDVTAFVPVARGHGTVEQIVKYPALTVAQLVHVGPFTDLDRTYGALGTIVAQRGIGGAGPIREHYLSETTTEVCWPVTTGAGG
jgi:DNA-binding transcriptional MerR regulator